MASFSPSPVRGAAVRRGRGFSLVELLVVLALMAVTASMALVVATNLRGGRDLGSQAARLMGVLEQAREHALAHGTYAYVCFAPDNASGCLNLVVMASLQGVGTFADAASLNADLRPVSRPMRFDNVVLDDVSGLAFGSSRPAADAQFLSALAPSPAPQYRFPGNGSPVAFSHVVRFNPRGEAEVTGGVPTASRWVPFPVTEIGLRAAKGGEQAIGGRRAAAIQLAGLTGSQRLFQP